MFVEVAPGIRARLEPFTGEIYLVHENRLRVVNRDTESYQLLRERLPAGNWARPFPQVPHNIQIQITHACNFACTFCYANAVNVASPSSHMAIERVKQLIDKAADYGVPVIQWVGGEAFIHKGFPEIVAYARSKGLVQTIITNGIIPGLQPERFRDTLASLSAMQLSMNAVGSAYDDLVGRTAFTKFQLAAKNLAAAVDQVWISCVLTAANFRQIPLVVQAAEEAGVSGVVFGMLVKKGRASEAKPSYFDFQPQADEVMRRVLERRPKVTIDYHLNSELSYVHHAPVMAHCDSRGVRGEGFSSLYINLAGDVYPFPALDELPEVRVGNAFSEDLASLWTDSPVLQRVRAASTAPHPCKDCPRDCSLRSLTARYLWFGNFEGKIPCSHYEYAH